MEKKDSTQSVLSKVNKIQKEIEENKRDRDTKLGRREEAISQLKRDFNIDNIDEAKRKMAELENLVSQKTEEIERLFKDVEEIYDF